MDGGHVCHAYEGARALKSALREESFDLLLLDWNLPESSGLELLDWARQNLNPCPPVIIVTNRTDSDDIVTALHAGADDYIVKPYDRNVLLARIEALLRRSYPGPAVEDRETISGVTFDHIHRIVTRNGRKVPLAAKQFGVALTFFRNIGRPLSRAYLLEAVWGRNPDLPSRTLDVHVSKVRTLLDLRPEAGFRLLPVHGFGYRLEAMAFSTSEEAQ